MSIAADNLFRDLNVFCSICGLGELCIPHGLSQQEVSQVDCYVNHSILLKAGDFQYKQNDTFESLYAVKSGSVKIMAQSHD